MTNATANKIGRRRLSDGRSKSLKGKAKLAATRKVRRLPVTPAPEADLDFFTLEALNDSGFISEESFLVLVPATL